MLLFLRVDIHGTMNLLLLFLLQAASCYPMSTSREARALPLSAMRLSFYHRPASVAPLPITWRLTPLAPNGPSWQLPRPSGSALRPIDRRADEGTRFLRHQYHHHHDDSRPSRAPLSALAPVWDLVETVRSAAQPSLVISRPARIPIRPLGVLRHPCGTTVNTAYGTYRTSPCVPTADRFGDASEGSRTTVGILYHRQPLTHAPTAPSTTFSTKPSTTITVPSTTPTEAESITTPLVDTVETTVSPQSEPWGTYPTHAETTTSLVGDLVTNGALVTTTHFDGENNFVTGEPVVTTAYPTQEETSDVTGAQLETTLQPLHEEPGSLTSEPAVSAINSQYEATDTVTSEPIATTGSSDYEERPDVVPILPFHHDGVAVASADADTTSESVVGETTTVANEVAVTDVRPFHQAPVAAASDVLMTTVEPVVTTEYPEVSFSLPLEDAVTATGYPIVTTSVPQPEETSFVIDDLVGATTDPNSEQTTYSASDLDVTTSESYPKETTYVTSGSYAVTTEPYGEQTSSDLVMTTTEHQPELSTLVSSDLSVTTPEQQNEHPTYTTGYPTVTTYEPTVEQTTTVKPEENYLTTEESFLGEPTTEVFDSIGIEINRAGDIQSFATTDLSTPDADNTYETVADLWTAPDAFPTSAPTTEFAQDVWEGPTTTQPEASTTTSASTEVSEYSTPFSAEAYSIDDLASNAEEESTDAAALTEDYSASGVESWTTYPGDELTTEWPSTSDPSYTTTPPLQQSTLAARADVPTSGPVQDFNYYDGVAFEDDGQFGGSPADAAFDYDSRSDEYDGDYFADAANRERRPLPPPPSTDTKGLEIASLVRETPSPPETQHRRSDVPIEDDDEEEEEEEEESNDVGFAPYPVSTGAPVVTTSTTARYGDTFEGQMLRRMVPLVVRQLKMGHISSEDLERLKYIFGPIWPEVARAIESVPRVRRAGARRPGRVSGTRRRRPRRGGRRLAKLQGFPTRPKRSSPEEQDYDEEEYEENEEKEYMGDEDYYETGEEDEDAENSEDVEGADAAEYDEYEEEEETLTPPHNKDYPSVMELHYRSRQARPKGENLSETGGLGYDREFQRR